MWCNREQQLEPTEGLIVFVSVVGYLKRFAEDEGSTPSKGSKGLVKTCVVIIAMCIGGCGSESQTAPKHPPLIKNNNKGSDNFEAGIDINVFLSADERL